MEKILLVEPNYKNKYPPIGLMKISTYFKSKGDFVEFHKGLLPCAEVEKFDKVFITTLFTFDFDMCIQTTRYYIAILGVAKVFIGGIAATIMPDRFRAEIPGLQLLERQLTSSSVLGYTDNINVDILALDYDILWDVPYEYPAADSYFIYTSRGCPRKCSFCAVKTLEPDFYECHNIQEQINNVNKQFGIKRQLLIMDNNILFSPDFIDAIDALEDLGFGINNNSIRKNSPMRFYLKSLDERIKLGKQYFHLLERIKKEFAKLKFSRISMTDSSTLQEATQYIDNNDTVKFLDFLQSRKTDIIDFFFRYDYHKIRRHIDFNQGLDARLLTEDKAQALSRLAIMPCRIAFDDLSTKAEYFSALELAVHYGIKHFSNYLLYNYKEDPGDLWERLYLNVEFCKKHSAENVSLFSFPMKYASIEHTDRQYVGVMWSKKELRAINIILNVTSGVVAKEEDFFLRAFGSSAKEFSEILAMPDDFIRYRDFFETYGLIQLWQQAYRRLSSEEKTTLLDILSKVVDDPECLVRSHCPGIDNILFLYTIRKKKMETNIQYYLRFIENHFSCNDIPASKSVSTCLCAPESAY